VVGLTNYTGSGVSHDNKDNERGNFMAKVVFESKPTLNSDEVELINELNEKGLGKLIEDFFGVGENIDTEKVAEAYVLGWIAEEITND